LLDTSAGFIQYTVESPKMISDTNGQEEAFPVLAIHNDNPFAVWNMGNIGSESAIMYNYSLDNGVTWVGEDTAFADTMPGSWIGCTIAPDPNSEDKWVSLAFDYTGDGSMDIVALHYYASGDTWNDELAASAPSVHPYCLPAVVVDYNSIPHIVFQENLTASGGMTGLAGWNQCGPAGTLYYIYRQGSSWSTPQKIVMTSCIQRSYEAGWPSTGIAMDNTIYFSTTLPESASVDTGAYAPFNVNYAELSPYTGAVNFGGKASGVPVQDSINAIYPHLTYNVPLDGPGITWCQMANTTPPADVYYVHKDSILGITESRDVTQPTGAKLFQNYPNPVREKTMIRFSVPAKTSISLDIYNISGRLVKALARGIPGAGSYSTVWDGTDNNGEKVPGGVYLYNLKAGSYSLTKKVLVIH